MVKKSVYETLSNNWDLLYTLSRVGLLPVTVIHYYKIYTCYKSYTSGLKRDKITWTSDAMKVCDKTILRAIKIMESYI